MEVRRRKNTKKRSQFHSIFSAFAPRLVAPAESPKNNFNLSLKLSGIVKKLPAFKKLISRQFILA